MRKLLYFAFVMVVFFACSKQEGDIEKVPEKIPTIDNPNNSPENPDSNATPKYPVDEVIVDIAPVKFYILIKDKAGVDLLDTTKTDAFVKCMEISYNNQVYPLEKFENIWGKHATRFSPPMYFGLHLTKYYSYKTFDYTGDWCMIFGEFDGYDKVEKREIVLTINKSKVYTIGYSNEITKDSDNHTVVIRNYYLNDQLLTDESGLRGRLNFVYTDNGELEYTPMEYK